MAFRAATQGRPYGAWIVGCKIVGPSSGRTGLVFDSADQPRVESAHSGAGSSMKEKYRRKKYRIDVAKLNRLKRSWELAPRLRRSIGRWISWQTRLSWPEP